MVNEDIEEQASKWLACLDGSNATELLRADFERWRTADPRHDAAYKRLAAAWQWLDRVQAIRPQSSHRRPDADFLRYRGAHAGVEYRAPARFTLRLALAAGVLLAVLIGASTVMWPRGSVYETDLGGFQRVVLSDGSLVEINTNSELRVRYERSQRKLELLRGEANFKVAPLPGRPFIVTMGETAVRAVGTQFNVRRFENTVEVLVTEGRVAIGRSAAVVRTGSSGPDAVSIVTAGEEVVANAQGVKRHKVPKEASARRLAWQVGMLAFEGVSLADAVAEFNRYNERQLVIDDPAVAAFKIGGYFRPTNLDAFVRVLETKFEIQAVPRANRIALSKAKS